MRPLASHALPPMPGSPRGDVTVVLTSDSLLVFLPNDGKLGSPVSQYPIRDAKVVMVQWETHSRIARHLPRDNVRIRLTPKFSCRRIDKASEASLH